MKNKITLLLILIVIPSITLSIMAQGIFSYIFSTIIIIISIFIYLNISKDLIKEKEEEEDKIKNTQEKDNNHQDEIVRDEIVDILEKLKIGFLGYKVTTSSNNPRIELIRNLLNESMDKFNSDLDETLKTLTEYGNANFAYRPNTSNVCGKTGSVLLGIRALGSSVSELIALINITAKTLNEEIGILSQTANNLSVSSNQQATSLEETAAALEEITSTIINNTENTEKNGSTCK